MSDVKLHFMHPTDGRKITVDVDSSMTADEAVNELIAANFIPPSEEGYKLAKKGGGAEMANDQVFADTMVSDGDTIRIIMATDAGKYNVRN